MRVFITGGTGFLGTHLSLRHINLGDEVIVLAKEATDAERDNAKVLRDSGVEIIIGTITDWDVVNSCCQDVNRVYHIAAAMREANVPDQVFWDVNVEATKYLLEVSRDKGVIRFVYCSSIGAMGKSMHKPASEESPCNPQDIYQITKKAAEELCLEFQRTNSLPLSIVRPADVYGPRDRRLLKLFRGIKKGRFAIIGNGENEHHMVYIEDMTDAFLLAAEQENAIGEVFIIAGEHAVSVDTLAQMIARETGGKIPSIKIPLLPIQMMAYLVESVCKPIGIQPPLYPRRVDFFRTDYAFDITKAKEFIGYQPKYTLEEGISLTKAWYEESGLL